MTLARTLRCSSPLLALALALTATGCEVDQKLGDLDDASATDSETSATDTVDPSSSSDEDSGDPPSACLQHENFTCNGPLDCSFEPCGRGGPLAEIDENGCLRPRCDNGMCPDGYSCVNLGDWGSCAASSWSCAADGDQCSCGGTADCSDSVSICVQDEVAPPAACNSFTDEASCLAAGCSAFVLAPVVEYDEAAGTCSCAEAEPEPTCLWFPSGNQGGDDVITPYYAYDSDGIQMRLLPASYDETPLGWHECSDVFDAETCACAQALSCA
jgi:hypothetical protein